MSDGAFDNPGDNPFANLDAGDMADDMPLPKLSRWRAGAMTFVGIVIGVIFGATAGGVTSGAIGCAAVVMRQPASSSVDSLFSSLGEMFVFGGLFGAVHGTWMGAIVGGVIGFICGTAMPLIMKWPVQLGAGLSALGGGNFGFVAGHLVFSRGSGTDDFYLLGLIGGGLLGVAAGVVAGSLLGRVLYGVAVRWWGQNMQYGNGSV